ncbi:MAG: MarR family transcriptional regulator [Deinococcota bacterium]
MSQNQKKRQQSFGRLFQRVSRAHNGHMLEQLAKFGHKDLTHFHTALITNLDREGNRISELAERAGMSNQSMGQLVSELEQRGYIQRKRDPQDGRAFLIHFSEQGLQLLQDANQAKAQVEADYATSIGDAGLLELRRLLEALLEAS